MKINEKMSPIKKILKALSILLLSKKLFQNFKNILQHLLTEGPKEAYYKVLENLKKSWELNYTEWKKNHIDLNSIQIEKIKANISNFKLSPKISIVLPVYNISAEILEETLNSVLQQIYPNWECCIADDASTNRSTIDCLKRFELLDPRIKVKYLSKNGNISNCMNEALKSVTGEFVAFLDHDDTLTNHALYMVAEEINNYPNAELIYSDEDKIDLNGNYCDPNFKPDWNYDLFLTQNYLNHLTVCKTSIFKDKIFFDSEFNGSQDYNFLLHYIEKINQKNIRHIPHVLYHWRMVKGSLALATGEKNYAHQRAVNALQNYLNRNQIKAKVENGFSNYHRIQYQLPEILPMVSIIICTKDKVHLLKSVVEGILNQTDYDSFEILIINNQSIEKETLDYFNEIKVLNKVRVLDFDSEFNFSAMNNLGVAHSKGEIVAFLNNDLEIIHKEWLKEMVRQCLRKDVGAVGCKLYYKNNLIQHAGVVLGMGGIAGHLYKRFSKNSNGTGVGAKLKMVQQFSAVTAACMLMRKDVFLSINGFDEVNLKVAFNDVDLCLRVIESGYKVVWTPHAELYHLESISRGIDTEGEKLKRFNRESDYMMNKYKELILKDPFYNPNLTLKSESAFFTNEVRVKKPWV